MADHNYRSLVMLYIEKLGIQQSLDYARGQVEIKAAAVQKCVNRSKYIKKKG